MSRGFSLCRRTLGTFINVLPCLRQRQRQGIDSFGGIPYNERTDLLHTDTFAVPACGAVLIKACISPTARMQALSKGTLRRFKRMPTPCLRPLPCAAVWSG